MEIFCKVNKTIKKHVWAPVSGNAYGANAVYIAEYGEANTIELIVSMTQNYPEFKTHPTLDVSHGYVKGAERFDENHESRVLGWEITPDSKKWCYRWLPTRRNDIYTNLKFSTNGQGRVRITIEMVNPPDEARQWESCFYLAPCAGLELGSYEMHLLEPERCEFTLNGIDLALSSSIPLFREISIVDSNFWIRFPLNAEMAEDPNNPRNRYKKRLNLQLGWIDLAPNSTKSFTIDIAPKECMTTAEPENFELSPADDNQLPWQHILWEARHNRHYTKSFNTPEKMVIRHVPARQWGRFFIWDSGMTAIAMADLDTAYCAEILEEMPLSNDKNIYSYGSYIVTAIYALWELYRTTGRKEYIARHFDHYFQLLKIMFDYQDCLVTADRGTGADDSPALFYAKGEIFAWEYQRTLPTNPAHRKMSMVCVGLTAHAIRLSKIMRNCAYIIGRNEEIEQLNDQIVRSEHELNISYWSDASSCYLDKLIKNQESLNIPWLYDFLPLFSGSVPENREKIMLQSLENYQCSNGILTVPMDSEFYRSHGYPNGSIWPPVQYFFWRYFLSSGQMEKAKILADKFINLYLRNHAQSLCCFEHYRAETGRAEGNSRFSSFGTLVGSVYHAHRVFGTLQASYEVIAQVVKLEADHAKLKITSPFYAGKTGLSLVLKPNAKYQISIDDRVVDIVTADEYGWCPIVCAIAQGQQLMLELIVVR